MASNFFDGFGNTMLDIFGEPEKAIFKSSSGKRETIEVIFDSAHREIDVDGKPYGAERPVAWIKTGLIEPKFNDVIEINGQDYFIKETKSDGLETTELLLAEPVK